MQYMCYAMVTMQVEHVELTWEFWDSQFCSWDKLLQEAYIYTI